MVCDNCPVGRYANHTGEGMRCFECPVGRSTTTREGESSSTGLEQCVRCGKLNGPRGGNFFYQDEMGQPSCKLCRSSGTPGGKNCDEETGATRVGDCWGLYTAASNCKKLQNIYGSVIISFISFVLTVSVLLPFVFLNGGLASVAQVWRRDIVGVTASWMSSTTVKAWKIKLRRIAIREKREREATAEGIFRTIRRRQGRSRLTTSWASACTKQLASGRNGLLHCFGRNWRPIARGMEYQRPRSMIFSPYPTSNIVASSPYSLNALHLRMISCDTDWHSRRLLGKGLLSERMTILWS